MPNPLRLGTLCALILAAAVAGCAPPRFASPPGPYAYREGWHEGCADGYAVAGSPLYETKFTAGPNATGGAYESGWQAGFNDCNSSYGRIQNTIHLFFAPS
jgi:hypothetical protein